MLDRGQIEAFDDPDVVLVHVRALEYGCFQFEVRRPAPIRGVMVLDEDAESS